LPPRLGLEERREEALARRHCFLEDELEVNILGEEEMPALDI
jgi:hypothetical protein